MGNAPPLLFLSHGFLQITSFHVLLAGTFSEYLPGTRERNGKTGKSETYLRSRLKVEYDIRRSAFEPFASIEWYNTLNNPQGNNMDRLKYIIGSSYKLNKKNALQLYYRYVNFTDDDESNGKQMLGLGYTHKF